MLTLRQEHILSAIVKEYTLSAQPVSSQVIETKYDFGCSSATISSDMQMLTEQGFLVQPHTSAGRVPTEKGYRAFVDSIYKKEETREIEQDEQDEKRLLKSLISHITSASPSLATIYYHDLFWKEGWEDALLAPEFEEPAILRSFIRFLTGFCFNKILKILNSQRDLMLFESFSSIF